MVLEVSETKVLFLPIVLNRHFRWCGRAGTDPRTHGAGAAAARRERGHDRAGQVR